MSVLLAVGQGGNQLGIALWDRLTELAAHQQKQHGCSSAVVAEWFSSSAAGTLLPRTLCIDSEPKVLQQQGCDGPPHRRHVLGHSGCGNNWAAGYSFGTSAAQQHSTSCAWEHGDGAVTRIDAVLEGVRLEAESAGGVVDFLLLSSLAGGTGSGTGSALLEALADAYPASTLAAVAIAPADSGDSTVHSINACLALQHLDAYAHAVVLLDNQTMLDQLDAHARPPAGAAASAPAPAAAGTTARRTSTRVAAHGSSSSTGGSSRGGGAASGRACLPDINKVAAAALQGLLWPLSEADACARRSSIRQLASTICADPLTKFVELCSIPADGGTSSSSSSSWQASIKSLSAQLPRFERHRPATPVTTSAALLISRGMPGTCSSGGSSRSADAGAASSCWHSGGWRGDGGGSWTAAADAVCTAWSHFAGAPEDVHLGQSPVALWSSSAGAARPSLTAAVRRSSTGSLLRTLSARTRQLVDAGAFMHWYERNGCSRDIIREAAAALDQAAAFYGG